MKRLIKSLFPLFSLLALHSNAQSSAETIPWRPLVVCDGSSGRAVLDDFVFTYYGQPVFQQQFVIRNETINAWLDSQGVVANEIAEKYPRELVIPLMRLSSDERSKLAPTYQNTLGAFTYVVEIRLPEVALHAYSRETGREQANWIFRDCSLVRD